MRTDQATGEHHFRRSGWRVLAFLAVVGVGGLAPSVLLNFLLGRAWYDLYPQVFGLLLAAIGYHVQLGRDGGPPLRVTPDHLELTVPRGGPVAIAWDNLARAEIRGRHAPTLVLALVDPARTRPVPDRADWERLGQWTVPRRRAPGEVAVSLIGLSPGPGRLRTMLATRVGPQAAPSAGSVRRRPAR